MKSDEATKIVNFIKEFLEVLTRFTGTGGRPLTYVLQVEDTVLPAEDQIAFGLPNSPFSSLREEV